MSTQSKLDRFTDKSFDNQDFSLKNRPSMGQVESVNTENELITVLGATGAGKPVMGVPHPFLCPNSWIRAYPEPGAQLMMSMRAEADYFVAQHYYRDTGTDNLRKAADAKIPTAIYRKMYAGEIELSSKGRGQVYLDKQGTVEIRSKLVKMSLNSDRLENVSYAPTHIREMHGKDSSLLPILGDEERFGLVKRSNKHPFFENYVGGDNSKTPLSPYTSGANNTYAKEYLRVIRASSSAGSLSSLAVSDYREGTQVINDLGKPDLAPVATVPSLPGPFRFRGKYSTAATPQAVASTALDYAMDLNGNVAMSLPANGNLAITSKNGNFASTFGGSWKSDVGGDTTFTSGGNYSITSKQNIDVSSSGKTSFSSEGSWSVDATGSMSLSTSASYKLNAASTATISATSVTIGGKGIPSPAAMATNVNIALGAILTALGTMSAAFTKLATEPSLVLSLPTNTTAGAAGAIVSSVLGTQMPLIPSKTVTVSG